MTQQDAKITLDIIIGTLHMFGSEAHVLIDQGATHSFISFEFITHVNMTLALLDCHIKIYTFRGGFLWQTQILKSGLLYIKSQVIEVNLILLDL